MRFWKTGALAAPAAGLLALACCLAADRGPRDDAPPVLTVHEWGTFSTFSGSDGKNLEFRPYDSDLPDFVHGYLPQFSKAGPKGGLISLETPVVYFYADRPLTASVHVDFPKGTMTEWYPCAGRTDHTLTWDGVKVLPGAAPTLVKETKASRYYAARETDADALTVAGVRSAEDKLNAVRRAANASPATASAATEEGEAVKETEKFLFYRGVGDADLPLKVRARGDGQFIVDWQGRTPAGVMLLVQVRGGKVRFEPFRPDQKADGGLRAEVRLPDNDSTLDQLGDAMTTLLTEQGLFDKEAHAMVKTWRSAWFGEDGTRVLYLLPRDVTDGLLPMRIDPKPTSLLRVLVGRHDVLTPEREREIDGWVATLTRPGPDQDARSKAASEGMAALGRYSSAAWGEAETRLQRRGP